MDKKRTPAKNHLPVRTADGAISKHPHLANQGRTRHHRHENQPSSSSPLRDKLDAARRRLEAQAQALAAAERGAYEAKVAAREKRRGRAKGKHPKPPAETPGAAAQSNLSDPDSRLMCKSKHHEYRQAYNAHAVVDAGGSQLIVGARFSQCASDRNELVADI